MKFHACICGPMSFDWHGSISPESALDTITRFDLSEFANLAEFCLFGLGDRIHPEVITITSDSPYYCIIFVPVIILNLCKPAAHACNDEM